MTAGNMSADNAVDYAHTSSERMMWQMVLLTAIEDAILPARSSREDIEAKRDAQRWLRKGDKDFCAVCNYAGFDPEHVRDAYLAGRLRVDVQRVGRNIGFQKRIVA